MKRTGKMKTLESSIRLGDKHVRHQNGEREEKTYIKYENRKEVTSHCPFRETVYPPTKVMIKVQMRP